MPTTIEIAVDNDVLIKAAQYAVLPELADRFGGPSHTAVLGAARYVVSKRLQRDTFAATASNPRAAAFKEYIDLAVELEPTPDEVYLATEIEEAGQLAGLALDYGESQLCAIALLRSIPIVLTGDKRAVSSLEAIISSVPGCEGLAGKVVCFEQAVASLIETVGLEALRAKICAQASADRVMAICFSCMTSAPSPGFDPMPCLESYIADLRKTSSTVLHAATGALS